MTRKQKKWFKSKKPRWSPEQATELEKYFEKMIDDLFIHLESPWGSEWSKEKEAWVPIEAKTVPDHVWKMVACECCRFALIDDNASCPVPSDEEVTEMAWVDIPDIERTGHQIEEWIRTREAD